MEVAVLSKQRNSGGSYWPVRHERCDQSYHFKRNRQEGQEQLMIRTGRLGLAGFFHGAAAVMNRHSCCRAAVKTYSHPSDYLIV